MAKQKKDKPFSGTSPKGVFKYPHLTNVDFGTDEYPKKNGEFNVKLIMSAEDAEAFRETLAEVHDKADELGKEQDKKRKPAARKKAPYSLNEIGNPVYDEDENETGEVEFNFKTAASGETDGKRWKRKLTIFDATGKRLKNCPPIWGGTLGRVAFSAAPYFVASSGAAGVALYLDAVKVLELVSAGEKSADAYGFGDEDDDYAGIDDTPDMDEDESDDDAEDDAEDDNGEGDF